MPGCAQGRLIGPLATLPAPSVAAMPPAVAPSVPESKARRPDLRLVLPALCAWGSAAAGLRLPSGWVVLVASLGGALGLLLIVVAARAPSRLTVRRWCVSSGVLRVAATCAVVGACAVAVAGLRAAPLRTGPLVALARSGATADVELVVTADPVRHAGASAGFGRRADLVVVPARAELVRSRGRVVDVRLPVTVLASGQGWDALLPGARVSVSGRLGTPRAGQAVAAVLSVRTGPRRLGRPGLEQRVAGRLRAGLRDAVAGLPPAERGLVPGLVDGDTSRLPDSVADDFRTAGLTHLTAVSGANVAFVVGAVLLLARRARLRGLFLPFAGTLALLGFVVLARPQPSVLRAGVMGLVALAALASGRRRPGVPALSAAVLFLVLLDPWQSVAFGFALSVVATAGLLVVAPPLSSAMVRRRVPEPVALALAVPVAAALVTAPITVLLSGTISLIAIPANLLVAPAVAPATLLGVGAAVLSPVSSPAAVMLGRLAGVPAAEIVWVAGRAAGVRGGAVGWPAGWPWAVALGALLLVASVAVPSLLRSRPLRVLVAAALAALLVQPAVQPHWPPAGWTLVACDVGQGDALVLRGGPEGAVVIDAGPDARAIDSCLHDLGIQRVAAVVLTHFHADHVEGLPGVLHDRSVAEIAVTGLAEPAAEAAKIRGWAAQAGLALRAVRLGEQREVGDVRWEVLAPARVSPAEGPNNASVVLLVRVDGLRILLSGDVEPPAQRVLAARNALRPFGPVDVLKVPHHGSAHQDGAFLTSLHPRISLISVGAGNDYGHPARATLDLLARSGSLVGRTDADGDLAVVVGPSGPGLVARGSPRRAARR